MPRGKEQRAVAAALAILGSDTPIPVERSPTPEEAEVEIGRIFAELGAALSKTKSVAKKKSPIRDARRRLRAPCAWPLEHASLARVHGTCALIEPSAALAAQ